MIWLKQSKELHVFENEIFSDIYKRLYSHFWLINIFISLKKIISVPNIWTLVYKKKYFYFSFINNNNTDSAQRLVASCTKGLLGVE